MVRQFAIDQIPRTGQTNAKREAFRRLAEKRTNAILEKIRILGNLANRSAYDYAEEDLRKIFGAIEDELKVARARFRATERREFRLN